MKRMGILAAAALLLSPAWLAAQRTPRPAPPPRPARGYAFAYGDNHGRIGVVVRTEADPETDKLGAKIEGVTPGGPAEKAGLKVGDIITKFNGTALADATAVNEDESGPGTKLVKLARKLDPGDTVQVEYRRGSDAKKATLVAEDVDMAWSFTMPAMPAMPDMPGAMALPKIDRGLVIGSQSFSFCFGETWCDLELVNLNADLGEYFGTKEGILVVKAPADSSLPLKAGDVILSVGGRKPSSPAHAMRILRSYEAGETVSIEILRKQKRTTLTWKVPEREERKLRHRPEREEQSGLRRLAPLRRHRLQRV